MSKVIVVGGGAAGMMAALSAAMHGHETILLEKNEKLGKKLYITGKGRCNVTNNSDMKTVMDNVISNPRFLYSSFKEFTNEDVMHMLEEAGCMLKTERGNRVFPCSDKSSDVLQAFGKLLQEYGVKVHLHTEVQDLRIEAGNCTGVILDREKYARSGNKECPEGVLSADAVIVTTGGLSYPATGSTGDGFRFARNAGHTVTKLYPALVPFIAEDEACKELQGLALERIAVKLTDQGKVLYENYGEMLFTHFGVSGPVLLSASSFAVQRFAQGKTLTLHIDLKPALTQDVLDRRILRDFSQNANKNLKNALLKLFPLRLIPEVIRQAGLDPDRVIHELSKEERMRLVQTTKNLCFTLTGTRGFKEAIITQGGVCIKEIHPKTMESKRIKQLYFAGEVLDLDALTGGYNLQIAWSTGWCAGAGIAYK